MNYMYLNGPKYGTVWFCSAVECPKVSDKIVNSRDPDQTASVGAVCFAGLPWSGKNIWKVKNFQVKEKSGNFVDGQEI